MRTFIIALLVGTTLAAPLAAQDRPDRPRDGRAHAAPGAQQQQQPPQPQSTPAARPQNPQGGQARGPAGAPAAQAYPGGADRERGGTRGQPDRRGDAGRFAGQDAGRFAGQDDRRGLNDRRGPDGRDPRAYTGGADRRLPPPGSDRARPAPGRPDLGRPDLGRADRGFGDRGFGDRGRNDRAQSGWDARGGQQAGWNRGWRTDRRYDWQARRASNGDRFRAPRYYPPRGYGGGYRRWSVGVRLAPLFFAQSYWLEDARYYDLPPAYAPYRWVRYYGDVLLVDTRNGYVEDVIPGFFL